MHCCYYLCVGIFCFTAYQQPFAPVPSQPCVGDAVTLPCEVLLTENGTEIGLVSATMTRDGNVITANNIPNHTLLVDDRRTVIGFMINDVTLDDHGIVYTCTATIAPADFFASLILNVTGTHTHIPTYIYAFICKYACRFVYRSCIYVNRFAIKGLIHAVSRHTFHHHLLATSVYQEDVCLLLLS